jgi:hypothetical protein
LPRRLLTGVAAAALLLVGACGGQQISAGVTNVPEAAGSGSASTVPELSLATGSAQGPAPTSATPGAFGGGGAAAATGIFCRDVAQQLSLLPGILSQATTPGKLS